MQKMDIMEEIKKKKSKIKTMYREEASWHVENGHNGRNQEEKVQNKDNVS